MGDESSNKNIETFGKFEDVNNERAKQRKSGGTGNRRRVQLNPNAEEWHPKPTTAFNRAHMAAFGYPAAQNVRIPEAMQPPFQAHGNRALQFSRNVHQQPVQGYSYEIVPVEFAYPGMMHHQMHCEHQFRAMISNATEPGHGNYYAVPVQYMEQTPANRPLPQHAPAPAPQVGMGNRVLFHMSLAHYSHWTQRTNFMEGQRYFPGPFPMYRLSAIPIYSVHHAQ